MIKVKVKLQNMTSECWAWVQDLENIIRNLKVEGQRERQLSINDWETSPVTAEVTLIVDKVKVIEKSSRSKVKLKVKLKKLVPVCLGM